MFCQLQLPFGPPPQYRFVFDRVSVFVPDSDCTVVVVSVFSSVFAFALSPPSFSSSLSLCAAADVCAFAFSAAAFAAGVGAITLYVSCPVFSTLHARANVTRTSDANVRPISPPTPAQQTLSRDETNPGCAA